MQWSLYIVIFNSIVVKQFVARDRDSQDHECDNKHFNKY